MGPDLVTSLGVRPARWTLREWSGWVLTSSRPQGLVPHGGPFETRNQTRGTHQRILRETPRVQLGSQVLDKRPDPGRRDSFTSETQKPRTVHGP